MTLRQDGANIYVIFRVAFIAVPRNAVVLIQGALEAVCHRSDTRNSIVIRKKGNHWHIYLQRDLQF